MPKMQTRLKTQGNQRTATGPIRTVAQDTRTGNGAPAFSRDAKSDLFLLAVSNFVGEETFYESAAARDERFKNLIHQVTAEDPEWVRGFVGWLRNEANMRSASIVVAAEYAAAGGPAPRQLVSDAMSRADEPGEMLAYWLAEHGKKLPISVKRGIGDGVRKLWNERSVLKYGSADGAVKFHDVLNLVHPKPRGEWQDQLFQYVVERGHKDELALDLLPTLAANRRIRALDPAEARAKLLAEPETLASVGMTWENVSSLGKMDKAAWEAMIPNMGYMALLRNLRNFDEAGVSDEAAQRVIAKLTDPDEVARSRQLPFRFWAAYKNAPSLRWSYPLEKALDLATPNVPELSGRTLVLVDTSASMTTSKPSRKSTMTAAQIAALFGAILKRKNATAADLVGFANRTFHHKVERGQSALTIMDEFYRRTGEVGHGTEIAYAINQAYNGHDRIVLISDMQTSNYYSRAQVSSRVPTKVPIYGFNLGGYGAASLAAGDLKANEHEFGGMSDKTFSMINMIEQAKSASWPWIQNS